MNRIIRLISSVFILLFYGCASAPSDNKNVPNEYLNSQIDLKTDKRMISYTAIVRLEIEDNEIANSKIEQLVIKYNGLIPKNGTSNSIIKIPKNSLTIFISELKQVGTIISKDVTGIDVTEYYVDLGIKLDSLKRLKEKYILLLEKAKDVADLLQIEKELERINLEIEGIEGKKINTEKNIEYATITIYFTKKVNPGPIGWVFVGIYSAIKWLFVWE